MFLSLVILMGLEATFSSGMVSAIRDGLIQIDAPISPGSSGGPVANEGGEVVGFSKSSIVEGQNLNFAVPIAFVRSVHEVSLLTKDAGVIALTDVEYKHFFGRVRSVMLRRAGYDRDNRRMPERLTSMQRYNEAGYLVESCDYDKRGTTDCTVYTRDEQSFILETTRRRGIKAEEPFKVSPDVRGLLEMGMRPFSKEWLDDIYDARGNRIERLVDGGSRPLARMTYDDAGREIDAVFLDQLGAVDFRTRSKYQLDLKGNWIASHQEVISERFPQFGSAPFDDETREISYW